MFYLHTYLASPYHPHTLSGLLLFLFPLSQKIWGSSQRMFYSRYTDRPMASSLLSSPGLLCPITPTLTVDPLSLDTPDDSFLVSRAPVEWLRRYLSVIGFPCLGHNWLWTSSNESSYPLKFYLYFNVFFFSFHINKHTLKSQTLKPGWYTFHSYQYVNGIRHGHDPT